MEGRRGLKLRLGGRSEFAWTLGGALLTGAGCLLLMFWLGGRAATELIAALVKVLFWGFGFGWVGGTRL